MFKRLQQLLSTLTIIVHPNGGIKYISRNSASLASFGITHALSKIAPTIQTVIDVGANIGQFATAIRQFYPDSQIFSFEPVPKCFQLLQKNTKDLPCISVFNLALGLENGNISFFENAHSHASSALKVSDYQKINTPKTKTYKEIEVDCQRLDDFKFEKPLQTPILLKLDVQGFEKSVLEGATLFLNQVDFLLLETSFIAMYDNEPLFDEMHSYLKEKGFKLVAPIGALPDTNLAIPQLDMLYKRINSN